MTDWLAEPLEPPDDEDGPLAIRLSPNGPAVVQAVHGVIDDAYQQLQKQTI